MFRILSQLLDLIYKKHCYFCRSTDENSRFCSRCYNKLKFLPAAVLKTVSGVDVYSAVVYKDDIIKMIRGVKYHNQRELACFQAKIMYEYWCKFEVSKKDFVIIPVPISKKRQRERHYNHMSLVAKEFSKMTGYEIDESLIVRVKDTKPQYKLTRQQRAENLKGAFYADSENVKCQKDRKLLIFDDIFTTGSTVAELAKILFEAGAQDVTAFTTSCTQYNARELL